MSQVAAVFKLNPKGFNLRRGISNLVVMLLPLVVLGALGQGKYFISVALAALFTGLCDPVGNTHIGRRGWPWSRSGAAGKAGRADAWTAP